MRLSHGRGNAPRVAAAARELILLLAQEFPDRCIHTVGDAAYHGKALLVERTTVTTRGRPTPRCRTRPPGTGKRGRPRVKGHRLGPPAQIAAAATWRQVTVSRYGRRDTVEITVIDSIWYGAFGNTEGRTVLVREPGSEKVMAIFTTDTTSDTETVVARYADRWPIEVAIAGGKQLLGIGQARNRLQRAVERTVPLSFCVYSLVVVWYTLHGYHPDDLTGRRADQPGTRTRKTSPSKTCSPSFQKPCPARITGVDAAQPDPRKYRDYELACAAAPRNCESQDCSMLRHLGWPARPVGFPFGGFDCFVAHSA